MEERALRAEEREMQHQDYWAARYAEKLEELERLHSLQLNAATRSASERFLQVYRRNVELAERLSRYEAVAGSGGPTENSVGQVDARVAGGGSATRPLEASWADEGLDVRDGRRGDDD